MSAMAAMPQGDPGIVAGWAPPPPANSVPAGSTAPGTNQSAVVVQVLSPTAERTAPQGAPEAPGPRRGTSAAARNSWASMTNGSDDNDNLSNSYRNWGGLFHHNSRAIIPRRLRGSCIIKNDGQRWTVNLVSNLDENEVDELSFVLSGLSETSRICDLGVHTKGQLRAAFTREVQRSLEINPQRHFMLAPDLSNLTVLCLRLGLPLESIAPERRPVQPSPMRGALPALTNGDLQQQAAAIAAAGICEAGADTAHSDKKEDAEAAGEECQAPTKKEAWK